jgi:hypothetical protein
MGLSFDNDQFGIFKFTKHDLTTETLLWVGAVNEWHSFYIHQVIFLLKDSHRQ